jgi:predicted Zn-dependent protease with MMP-like domain
MHMSEAAFRRLVEEALGLLPAEFRPYLEGVPVVIAEWPSEALLDELEIPGDDTLYGLYSGRALTEGPLESGELPSRITLFRGPLLEDCRDEDDLRDEIATTVLHEIAHHFGISEARLEELGWG